MHVMTYCLIVFQLQYRFLVGQFVE